MTITSNLASPPLDEPDVDQRPGSSGITWAELAYHHPRREPSNERRRVPRASRRGTRILVVALAIFIVMAGLVVAMRYEGSSPSPVVNRPTSSQAANHETTARSPFTLTPPLLRPFPSLPSMSLRT